MTAMDAVVDKLVEITAMALPEWQVIDGWNRSDELEQRVLSIAQATSPGVPAVTSTVDIEDGGLCATVETISVACTAASWDGEMTFAGKRAQVVAAVNALHAALRNDLKLGGLALETWLTAAQLYQEADERGPTVQCDFAVTVTVHAE